MDEAPHDWAWSYQETIDAHRDEFYRQQRLGWDGRIELVSGKVKRICDLTYAEISRQAREEARKDVEGSINRQLERQRSR